MNQVVIMSFPYQQFQHLASFPAADQVDQEEETNTLLSLEECEDQFCNEERYDKLKGDELDSLNASIALNDLSDLRDGWTSSWKKKNTMTETTNPVQSILKNGSGDGDTSKKRKSRNFKHLSFALSPTFIDEPKARPISTDSMANDSIHSLDQDDIFGTDEQNPESSMKIGEISGGRPSRRNSLTQFKARSSLGFDERVVGFSESDMGSIGNFSWSSI
jgi:hypothetical protein